MSKRTDLSPTTSLSADVAGFLKQARESRRDGRRGRLIFALDATMSRQPTWDAACALQAEMFDAAAAAGGLEVQLVYYRGRSEARSSGWVTDASALSRLMTGIACHGGLTQLGKVLDHAVKTARQAPLSALVFVGDAMEENVDRLCHSAGELGLRNTRAFMFHEGTDPAARRAFREVARLTGGAYLPFDRTAANELKDLLRAVGCYAAGGRLALEASGSAAARRLLADLRP